MTKTNEHVTVSVTLAGFAANVSHDIVGPGGQDVDKLELYTRWLQWATYSGIFRSHDRGSSAGNCAGDFPSSTTSNTCKKLQKDSIVNLLFFFFIFTDNNTFFFVLVCYVLL